MRHLNEIVRERNQYSRDAMEAWQDFINLKSRMDMELTKVTNRNNFLVEELENLRQQFLKFQAFAEQLTKETQDLKIKIDEDFFIPIGFINRLRREAIARLVASDIAALSSSDCSRGR